MTQPAKETYQKYTQEKYTSEFLRNKLKLKSLETKTSLFEKYPHVKKFLDEKGLDLDKIRKHSAKVITTGALTGTLLFAVPTPSRNLPVISSIVKNITDFNSESSKPINQEKLLTNLREILPDNVGPLTRSQEKQIEKVINDVIGVNTKATLEGEHLNTTYGFIGLEQHLARYPGDNVTYMAPGRGAWGYFAGSKSNLTEEAIEREKWYVAVQTLYLPDWEERLSYVKDWYKYRKVLVVNTANGNAVIADIAEAGPAAWTGKQFGGSPEVMNSLGGSRYTKGAVVMFFVDDPKNKVPLGPIQYNNIDLKGVTMVEV
ncbi:MAG: hypothetical protein UU51_C0004G0019 [Microgenomates group bacterium GW2011_GWC1_41_20]|uniref:Uncharacterized protein n=7 Tax=Candidatus Woeseibacteriota TaxID=1752722 RepID=A0A0G0RSK7_9BACT|nr:MAG: hypothetical protein UT76_C0003G0013 [Candidatus Woesebacteria bacterium GW2011_GWB1_40_12]KKR55644.1 MAG: hypothetical protein UT93_C0020G0002 [Candidatus Woesebacteria bacterium GW2011_GWF1_40_24]KKR90828.1 MAG: hypothetical protein UU39_C0007G0004 [Candidatus Woesebacteria bacterium GW2011_GWD1_41_12]KKS00624.1 MAG: hypothetical protein UU51_C0004G0019 [Microgenomates group bacterium GW2011_GWC1_41_20]KKS05451.1 MAG: hypothetical protein UU57_C0006G0002 [Candidatus Woesebacteria bact